MKRRFLKSPLLKRLSLILASCVLVTLLLFMWLGATQVYDYVLNSYTRTALACANTIMVELSDEDVTSAAQAGPENQDYIEINEFLQDIAFSFSAEYIYILLPNALDNTVEFLFAVSESSTSVAGRESGTVVFWRMDESAQATYAGAINAEPTYMKNEYGETLTCYAPLFVESSEQMALIGVDFNMSDVREAIFSTFIGLFFMVGAALLVLLAALIYMLRTHVVRPVIMLSERMNGFVDSAEKEFIPLEINTKDEMQQMAVSFNKMAGDIRDYTAKIEKYSAEEARITTELTVARSIQSGLLPLCKPYLAGRSNIDLYASMDAARMVGGDFYDFFSLGENETCIVIGDVSGKGISASLFMMMAKTVVMEYAQRYRTLSEALYNANVRLLEGNEENMFVTLFIGVLNAKTGVFRYCSAGHNPPYISHGGTYSMLDTNPNIALGVLELDSFSEQQTELERGDAVFIYTDGVTEAMNTENKLFTEARLEKSLNNAYGLGCKATLEAVRRDVDEFARDAEQADDITMLMIKRTGGK